MTSSSSSKSGVRFLSFANDGEDAEKAARLKEAAAKIEQAIAREKQLGELIDYVPPPDSAEAIDPACDTRPLYERLLEQQNKKKEALEESQKLSNRIAKLDEDDIEHLHELAKQKREDEIRKKLQVHDLLEEQKLRQERKLLEEEKKRKDSLLAGLKSESKVTSLSRLKSKLPIKLKMKPKIDAPKSSQNKPTYKRKPTDDNLEHQLNSDSDKESKRLRSDDSAEVPSVNEQQSNKSVECKCNNASLTRCIGILPSLPIVTRQLDEDENEESSDNTDDDFNTSIVPKICRRR